MIKFKPLKKLKYDDGAFCTTECVIYGSLAAAGMLPIALAILLFSCSVPQSIFTWGVYYCCPIFEMLGDDMGKLISAYLQTIEWLEW